MRRKSVLIKLGATKSMMAMTHSLLTAFYALFYVVSTLPFVSATHVNQQHVMGH